MKAIPKAIDLFAGCGGCTVGLKASGFRVVGAVEIDARASGVYTLNHPEVHLWQKDITRVSVTQMRRILGLKSGELDLLAGCPPCQGFSSVRTLNRKSAVRDKRNDLVFQFERLIVGLRPKAVMLENVPGLAANQRFARFRARLRKLGYVVNAKILDAADYGVPQRRRRLILLAGRTAIPFGRKQVPPSVRDTIAGLPRAGSSGDPVHDLPEKRSAHIMKLIKLIPKDGGSRSALPRRMQLPCHRRCKGFCDIYGRLAWDRVAPTLTTGCFNPSRGRFLHPRENRAITMREAALLQTFPPGYKFPVELGKLAIASMIGNALPPEFIRRHAESVLACLSAHP